MDLWASENSRPPRSPPTCEFGADACDEEEVRAEVVLSAGDAERGFDDADPAEPDVERVWGGYMPCQFGCRRTS